MSGPSGSRGLVQVVGHLINDLIYVTIGVSLGVFFMRRWAHRRRQARAGDAG